MNDMSEKKYVTLEMFEEYHKNLMNYIGMHDDLMLDGETICPKCGATITSDKCENCMKKNEVEV
jgi:predicted amidophosphoribosyltransferase